MRNNIQVQLSRASIALIITQPLQFLERSDIVAQSATDPVLRTDVPVYTSEGVNDGNFFRWKLGNTIIDVGDAVVVPLVGDELTEDIVTDAGLTVRVEGNAIDAVAGAEFESSVYGCCTAERVAGDNDVGERMNAQDLLDAFEGWASRLLPVLRSMIWLLIVLRRSLPEVREPNIAHCTRDVLRARPLSEDDIRDPVRE